MISSEEFFKDIKEISLPFFDIFCQQSLEVQQKLIEIFAKHNSLVTADEYQRQIELFQSLKVRCAELEQKINTLLAAHNE
jgi:hypothetical protein